MGGLSQQSLIVISSTAGATGVCLYLLLRKEDDWEEEVQGGVTSRQVAIDVKIPKDSVGIVIGRQGSNIR